MASSSLVRIAVVGDIHGFWNLNEDRKALGLLQPDLVLFTGDFGEEDVPLVQSVAALPFPKAVILGNHDAWHTQKLSKKQNGVQMQLDILGAEHVGYQRLDFPSCKLSIVGGRPFSHGGDQLHRKKLLVQRYGVRDMDASAGSICRAALGTPEDHVVIILAHNGPTGLGSQADDICGRDWAAEGGDHGDPDLEQALRQLKETTKLSVPLVVFGHMHKELESGKGNRKMVVQDSDNQIVYVNGAIVPRVKEAKENCQGSSWRGIGNNEMPVEAAAAESENGGTIRAFTLVEILDGKIKKVAETWVQVIGSMAKVVDEKTLFEDVT
uniref:Calcineurin-like phosphoesterase domain-containing protein n=1 Tax=Noccaea caerulescens TaxID=107243 RepID=A0A1J3HP19_NOCCA